MYLYLYVCKLTIPNAYSTSHNIHTYCVCCVNIRYGHTVFANKATGHELQGLQHLMYFVFKEGVAGLHFPLMCVADFMGHRISVQVRYYNN